MKKFLFYTFIILSIIVLADIAGIILFDMERLTRYGWGYLTGRVLLLVLFVFLVFIMFKKTYGKTVE